LIFLFSHSLNQSQYIGLKNMQMEANKSIGDRK
jgi:hypothetical protein